MKMLPEHRAVIKAGVQKYNTDFHRSRYAAAGLSDKQFRWDCAHAAGLTKFFCDELYKYLNDEHIDSALRSIIKPLDRSPVDLSQML